MLPILIIIFNDNNVKMYYKLWIIPLKYMVFGYQYFLNNNKLILIITNIGYENRYITLYCHYIAN